LLKGAIPMKGQPVQDQELISRIYDSVARREATYDGIYYTGVHSTGIFCRPSCRSRTPLLKNVSFYTSMDAARQAGFRPCKRCKPETPGPAGPEERLIEAAKAAIKAASPKPVTLAELAAGLHISPYYLQRLFKRHTGVSPGDYSAALRLEEAQKLLAETDLSITETGKRAGFSSPAYFSAFFQKHTGQSPTAYREEAAAKRL
jgi:AraC family transcriptional regulator, regulatory protein of adaptative response / methylphosphotriester-DNA alkyltransferase methyltransferase